MTTPTSKPKPFKVDTLEPDLKESLRRVSRWPGLQPDNDMAYKINGINAKCHARSNSARRR